MLHYNYIKEGQSVKYCGHKCTVVKKSIDNDGIYHLTLVYPNPLMMDVTCFEQSDDGEFNNIEP